MSSISVSGGNRSLALRRGWTRADLEALVPVLAPAALLSAVLAGIATYLVVPDTWVAFVSGREIADHGIPRSEHLTVLAQGHRWVDQQWLAQLVLYSLQRVGGIGLAIAVCNLAVVVAFAFAARAAQERNATPGAILAVFVLAFAAAPWGVQARTQALALPLFTAVVWLLLRDPHARRRSTLWVLPILCLWANIHGSVTLAALLVALYGLAALIHDHRNGKAAALLALAPVTVLASPYVLGLPTYYRTMLLDPPYGHDIVEWQRTTPSGITAFFFGLAALTLVLLVLRRHQVALFDWVLLGVTFAAALSAVRLIAWFALAAVAVVPPLASRRPAGRFQGNGALALVAISLLGIIGATAWTAGRSYTGVREARAAAAVRAAAGDGKVFADLSLADWLLWEVPTLHGRVAYDGRPEILTRRQFTGVVAVARRTRGWRSQVRGYDTLVVPTPKHHPLRISGWRRVYTDDTLVVYRRA